MVHFAYPRPMTYPQTEWDFGAELPLSPENMWGSLATPETDVELDSETESDHIKSPISVPRPFSPFPRIPPNLPPGTAIEWVNRLTWEVDLYGRRRAFYTVIAVENGRTILHETTPLFFPESASLPPSLPVAGLPCSQMTPTVPNS